MTAQVETVTEGPFDIGRPSEPYRAIGLVSVCGARDLQEVQAMGFQYFARGSVASRANFGFVRTGVPFKTDGMEVQPGDLNGRLTRPGRPYRGTEEGCR